MSDLERGIVSDATEKAHTHTALTMSDLERDILRDPDEKAEDSKTTTQPTDVYKGLSYEEVCEALFKLHVYHDVRCFLSGYFWSSENVSWFLGHYKADSSSTDRTQRYRRPRHDQSHAHQQYRVPEEQGHEACVDLQCRQSGDWYRAFQAS